MSETTARFIEEEMTVDCWEFRYFASISDGDEYGIIANVVKIDMFPPFYGVFIRFFEDRDYLTTATASSLDGAIRIIRAAIRDSQYYQDGDESLMLEEVQDEGSLI